jgi:UDP-N-acetylglucosamine--N-acetylmuramyl-(pentapeptide) pyrophosphoryl-undecaprenol N-acetylglucosamine transferase
MNIVLAGGGTAGHIEPALAVARAWLLHHPKDQIEFIGTSSGLENQLVPAAGFKLSHIPKVIIPRKFSLSLFVAPTTLTQAFLQARSALKGADLLIGFGGYVSAPAYLAARSLNIPFVIHGQMPNRA